VEESEEEDSSLIMVPMKRGKRGRPRKEMREERKEMKEEVID